MARHRILDWIAPSVLWLWLFHHLHYEWTLNPQYNYGWTVPFLGALIFFLRWRRRPSPGAQIAGGGTALLLWLILLSLLPFRVIEEANPDWRLLGWAFALLVVSFTMVSLARAGGMAWVRHFAFAICFPLVAVPWPVRMENFVVQNLMRIVTYLAVEIAGWIGVGAYQVGNVIELRNGFVGVDDACSGVRTLQAGIMVALVLGELLRLRRRRRLALVLFGCAWVFACNVFRATALVIVTANSGLDSLARWHDSIGTLAMVAGLAGVLGLAWIWKTDPPSAVTQTETPARQSFLPGQLLELAWLVAVFGFTEVWYRSHERQLVERPPWHAQWPHGNETLRLLPVPETTRVILRCDDSSSAAWEDPRGVRWWSFFARWKPERAGLQLVRSHSPEICLPAIGRTFRSEHSPATIQAGSISLDFRVYEFEEAGRPLFVFLSIQDDKGAASTPEGGAGEWNTRGRLRAAWRGQRNPGQRLLEIAVIGFEDYPRATEAAARTVNEIVREDQPTG
ncbi:MAG TPA: exosortase/archaeosortase family protein [Chthoniobacterales bacterium]|nr:exosortase/archaeosortase family protein [Chthoniobacterales bacterium]